MKFDSALMARLQAATQDLMKDGPLTATAAIQRALAGDTAGPAEAGTTGTDGTNGASGSHAAQPGATMKDLNAPPEKPQPRPSPWARKAARTAQSPRPEAKQEQEQEQGQPKAGTVTQGMADMLAKAGITLPEGFAAGLQEKFKGGLQGGLPEGLLDNLPEALKNANLPGARKRPPPPPLKDGARFDSASFTCHAGTRGYKLYVPSTYTGQPMPLVVMLHGCTQDPDDFAAGTRMNEVAEETGCLVAYPAQSQQANSSKCWNWFSAADQQRDRGEPAIVAGIARQVMADYAVDPARVGIAGLSAGGAMALVVAALYPDLFKAAGVHSGLAFGSATDLPSALQAMQKGSSGKGQAMASPPLIVFHGDKDRTVHPKNGSEVLQHGLAAHGTATPEVERGKASGGRKYTRTLHRGKDGRVVAEHWELHGAGHAWAGGSASGSYTDPTGPDASREFVRFLAQA